MPANYVLLERIELNASAASVTFSNIPQTGYTDLKIVVSARTDSAGGNANPWTPMVVQFNGTSTTTSKQLYGTGSGTGSDSSVNNVYSADTNNTASTFSSNEIYIPNYTGSSQKSYSADSVTENNATGALALMSAGLTNVTVGITSVRLAPDTGNFAAGSTFSLYGIANASTTPAIAPKADGGNIIATDGTYWYHAFLANGTFTPQTNLTCETIVVAGGGGANGQLGGAGAGGLIYRNSALPASTPITVLVGAGGAGNNTSESVNGSDSFFGTLKAFGGGGGPSASSSYNGKIGGSGGGGENGAYTGGASSQTSNNGGTGYGFAGGTNTVSTNYRGAGGGGAGGVGKANNDPGAADTPGGAGGVGLNTWASWASATGTGVSGYFAGGGGSGAVDDYGGAGGLGGGGAGGQSGTSMPAGAGGKRYAGNGVANTGGGAGGPGWAGDGYGTGGSGGSGIVIVRYAVVS